MYQQYRTLRRLFWLLRKQGIRIKRFRADSGSYTGAVVDWVSRCCDRFYIKARGNESVLTRIAEIREWEPGRDQAQWGEISFTPFSRSRHRRGNQQPQAFRLVVERCPDRQGQRDLFTGQAWKYQAILTSDWQSCPEEIFSFYRQRGGQEREFDVLKNDFGWNRLPFSRLCQNTVYLLLTALIRNLYGFVITRFSEQVGYLHPRFRLKKFIFRFISVPAKWIRTARQTHLKLYTPKLYPE